VKTRSEFDFQIALCRDDCWRWGRPTVIVGVSHFLGGGEVGGRVPLPLGRLGGGRGGGGKLVARRQGAPLQGPVVNAFVVAQAVEGAVHLVANVANRRLDRFRVNVLNVAAQSLGRSQVLPARFASITKPSHG